MNPDKRNVDSELRELLKRGDPALDGREPSSLEISRMRRTILEGAVSDGIPQLLRAWAPAGAVGLLLVVILGGWLATRSGARGRPDSAPGNRASEIRPDSSRGTPPSSGVAGQTVARAGKNNDSRPSTAATRRSRQRRSAPALGSRDLASLGGSPSGPPSLNKPPARPLRIEFTTATGIRILWTLDPDLEI